jgi:hypothetical protein
MIIVVVSDCENKTVWRSRLKLLVRHLLFLLKIDISMSIILIPLTLPSQKARLSSA